MQPQNPPVFSPANKGSKAPLLAIVFGLLFIFALSFGIWAYSGKQTAQKNTNAQVASAVASAKTQQQAADQATFSNQLKKPYQAFTGQQTYGSITFSYPKSWSGYVDETSSDEPINGYFYPGVVPGISGNTAYALRIELVGSSYSSVLSNFQTQIQAGQIKASAFVPAKLAKNSNVQRGTRLDGQINDNQNGAEIIIPVRTQTLELYTESKDYLSDFNNIVLPSLSFSP